MIIIVIMPRRCSVFGCNGNFDGQPYSQTVSASRERYPEDREKWIAALPNERKELERLKEIHVCKSHFNCEWYRVQGGGERPMDPPTIFPGVAKSCLKQTKSQSRRTTSATVEARSEKTKKIEEDNDKIKTFETFADDIAKRHKHYIVIRDKDNLYLSLSDNKGQKILQFIHFKKVTSSFGFLFLALAERDGFQISKKLFPLQKNSLVSKWSQVTQILTTVTSYEPTNEDLLNKALDSLKLMRRRIVL